MVLEKTLESPLDSKEIKPVNPKGNQPWIFTGSIDAEAEALILWPPNAKSWLIGKDPDAGKDWEQEEKGMTKDEMVWWHYWLNGHEFEQTLGDGWRKRKPGVLQSMGSQKVRRYLATEQQHWSWYLLNTGGQKKAKKQNKWEVVILIIHFTIFTSPDYYSISENISSL